MTLRQTVLLLEHIMHETEEEYRRHVVGNPNSAQAATPRLSPKLDPKHRQLSNEELLELFRTSLGCDGSMLIRQKVLVDTPYFQFFELLRGVTLECFMPLAQHSTIYIVPPGTARTRKFIDFQSKVFLMGLGLAGLNISSPKTPAHLRRVFKEGHADD